MNTEILIAGQGGQGILTLGHILAEAAFSAGLETTWLPSYGPEQRGGTCNATVVISSSPISSPIASRLDFLLAFNHPSVSRFSPLLSTSGVLISDADGAFSAVARDNDCEKLVGMVMLGNLLRHFTSLSIPDVVDALRRTLPPHRQNLIDSNIRALNLGLSL